jgi:hypothetical protein
MFGLTRSLRKRAKKIRKFFNDKTETGGTVKGKSKNTNKKYG